MSGGAAQAELPARIAAATAEQPAARAALAAALAAPSHAYLFSGPAGSGKRASARAFVAELLAGGADDPDDARRRALADPSPHPDLAWLRPPGAQHLVDEVRARVIEAISLRPFEGERRAFVIEAADLMAEESQNALLKTLEEPAGYAHLVLVSSQPSALLETVRSRCQTIRFVALSPQALEARLAGGHPGADPLELRAAARLSGGDLERAELLLSAEGRELRAAAGGMARAALTGELDAASHRRVLEAATAAGEAAGEEARARVEELALAGGGDGEGRAARRATRDAEEASKRAGRRARTQALDAALALVGARLRDLAALGEGARELVLTADRVGELEEDAHDLDPRRARRAAELVMDTRRRLVVNVNEELALEALCFRLEFVLRAA